MNKFEQDFFKKYIPEGQELFHIIHTHPLVVIRNLIVQIILLLVLPIGFFYFSKTLHKQIPFFYFEIYIFLVFFKIIYDIFNWYNDVWIVTNTSVVALNWSFFKVKTESITFENIEGVGVDEDGILDKLMRKGDVIIHKAGEEELVLENAISPYKAIDAIEEASTANADDGGNITEERFNLLLEALSGAVGEHLGKKEITGTYNEKKEKLKKEILEKAEHTEGTIDLR
ncbi:hypothetical protein D8B46_02425 [Candidatus Gracilibacteria bacterium]|nr:MAG: hypothetical protein D8B46_02425 [Candidatus Gracilibacteria bacterium]